MNSQSTDWEVGARLRRGAWLMRAHVVEVKAARLAEAIRATKFDPNQPRVPRGNPDGGQWTDSGGGGGGISDSQSDAIVPSVQSSSPRTQLVGGFTPEDDGLTVQDFVSANCKGLIHRVLPSQFLGVTIGELRAAAKGGDAAARSCLKLLGRDEYRK